MNYEASHTKSSRRTKAEMEAFYALLLEIVAQQQPMTVRQVFYQAEVRGLVEKEESGYTKVQRALMHVRRTGMMPFLWITDNTRRPRKPPSYNDLDHLLESAAISYRRAVWADLDQRLEIWCEKDALAGVILPVTAEYDVPLMVARGYSSASFTYSAAEEIGDDSKYGITTYIYHLGDYDPSGQDAARDLEAKLREYAPAGSFVFQQLAVTPEQIADYNLPRRPTKMTDTRARRFHGDSVELDALPADSLRTLVREAIERHLPLGYMEHVRFVEHEERRMLTAMMNGGKG